MDISVEYKRNSFEFFYPVYILQVKVKSLKKFPEKIFISFKMKSCTSKNQQEKEEETKDDLYKQVSSSY